MSMPDDFHEEPRNQGMSSTAKVLLILGSIAGVLLLACCGGGVFLFYKTKNAIEDFAKNAISNDPAEIRRRTQEIVHIDIPEGFEPSSAFQFSMMNVSMKQVAYQREGNAGSTLMIMETNQPMPPGGARQQRAQMRQAMRQQAGQPPGGMPGDMRDEINEETSETREFTINGEKVAFDFIKGTAANGATPVRQVEGDFRGRSGTVMIILMVPEDEYDEVAVVEMIESIRLPGASSGEGPNQDSDRRATTLERNNPAAERADSAPDEEGAGDGPSESTPE